MKTATNDVSQLFDLFTPKTYNHFLQSDKYRQYLTTMSRFHRYSARNSLLILLQNPDASYVAGFQHWKNAFQRFVRKGEHGIQIIGYRPSENQCGRKTCTICTATSSMVQMDNLRHELQLGLSLVYPLLCV